MGVCMIIAFLKKRSFVQVFSLVQITMIIGDIITF